MFTLSEWPVSLEAYCRIRSKWTAPVPLWWLLYYLQCGQLHFPSGGSSSTYTMWTAPFSLWWLLKYLHNVDSSIFPLVAPQVLTQCGQLHFPSGGSSSTYTMWTAPFSLWGLLKYLHNVDSSIFPLGALRVPAPDTPDGMRGDTCRTVWSLHLAGTPHSSPDAPSGKQQAKYGHGSNGNLHAIEFQNHNGAMTFETNKK